MLIKPLSQKGVRALGKSWGSIVRLPLIKYQLYLYKICDLRQVESVFMSLFTPVQWRVELNLLE